MWLPVTGLYLKNAYAVFKDRRFGAVWLLTCTSLVGEEVRSQGQVMEIYYWICRFAKSMTIAVLIEKVSWNQNRTV